MPRRPARIAESDITRAVRAYSKAGIQVRVIYNRDGSTVIEPCAPSLAAALDVPAQQNEWDAV